MKATDEVGITFANVVIGTGVLNGVVNVQFGAFQFAPGEDGQIDPDLVVVSRLRMDSKCAEQLYEMMGDLILKLKKQHAPLMAANGDGTVTRVEEGQPH